MSNNQCHAQTLAGYQCKKTVKGNSQYCSQHQSKKLVSAKQVIEAPQPAVILGHSITNEIVQLVGTHEFTLQKLVRKLWEQSGGLMFIDGNICNLKASESSVLELLQDNSVKADEGATAMFSYNGQVLTISWFISHDDEYEITIYGATQKIKDMALDLFGEN